MKPMVRGTPKPPTHPLWPAEQWLARLPEVLGQTDLSTTPDQEAKLAAYMALLQRWNGTYNLTALRAPEEMLSHHLADCLVVVQPLMAHLQARGLGEGATRAKVLDVGSGGGLPGVVLAILCPGVVVTCVDTVGKKAAFIRQVSAELGLLQQLRAEHARVEQLKGQFDVITSRAFASLNDFTDWTAQLMGPGSHWMAMKGKAPADELALLPATVEVLRVDPLVVPGLDAERCLVWMQPKG
jgi:16S rRNA (guanine527-N7)-methyltransferase